jgi:hypothetical protein
MEDQGPGPVVDALLEVAYKQQRMMDQLRDAVKSKDRDAVFEAAARLVGLMEECSSEGAVREKSH